MHTVTLARFAMATRFEIVLHGPEPASLRAAGEEALDEIERLESQLSIFRASSEISYLNAYAASRPIKTEPALFALLSRAKDLWHLSKGAFDITVGPLLRVWGFRDGSGRQPAPEEIERARACVGMDLVELNPSDFSVYFRTAGVALDLGAIGKGFAIGRAAEIVKEAGIEKAMLHGGTSTIYAIGTDLEARPWKIAIERPPAMADAGRLPEGSPSAALAVIHLKDEALSVSAVWGRFFKENGHTYSHLIDPRLGQPANEGLLAAAVLPCAMETDALSTALLIGGSSRFDALSSLRPGMRSLLVTVKQGGEGWEARARGIALQG